MDARDFCPKPRSGAASVACAIRAACWFAAAVMCTTAAAQRPDRSGEQVVNEVCSACHAEGLHGAPRIGDSQAWSARAAQGLTALTDHAIRGIREMPAHGGSPGVSDIEIERAIVVMVNRSGANWIEPLRRTTPAVARTGEEIVRTQCSTCHLTGVNGAPKMGDRAAWIPRLKSGMDALVASAVHGHGAMPARGGLPDLSEPEIRGAIEYMFDYGLPAPPPVAAAAPSTGDAYHRLVGGTDVYIGLIPAQSARAMRGSGAQRMHGGPGRGKDMVHLNISLADPATKASIPDAAVRVTVTDVGGTTIESRDLDAMAANNAVSYGNYFHMVAGSPYVVTARIRRPGSATVVEARFDVKAPY
jgi:cytochrome c5